MKRAWGYARVSTGHQFDSGLSLRAQVGQIIEYAKRNDLDLGKPVQVEIGGETIESRSRIVVESASASENRFSDRPAGGWLCAKIEPGDVVLLTKIDRGFRQTVDALTQCETWAKRNVGVVFLDMKIDTSTAAGKLSLTMLAAIAEMESTRRSERLLEARAEQLRQNPASLFTGNRPWAGFRFRGTDPKTRTVVPDDSRRWLMDQVYELWHGGRSVWKLSDLLNYHRKDVPREDGQPWEPRSTSEMIVVEHGVRHFESKHGAGYDDAAELALADLIARGMRRETAQKFIPERDQYIPRVGPQPAWLVDLAAKRSLYRPKAVRRPV